jgi:hypothetical protein
VGTLHRFNRIFPQLLFPCARPDRREFIPAFAAVERIATLIRGGEVDHDVELFAGKIGADKAVVEVEAVGQVSGWDEVVVAG